MLFPRRKMLVLMHTCIRNLVIAIINNGVALVISVCGMLFKSNRAVAKSAKLIIEKSINGACVKNMVVAGQQFAVVIKFFIQGDVDLWIIKQFFDQFSISIYRYPLINFVVIIIVVIKPYR